MVAVGLVLLSGMAVSVWGDPMLFGRRPSMGMINEVAADAVPLRTTPSILNPLGFLPPAPPMVVPVPMRPVSSVVVKSAQRRSPKTVLGTDTALAQVAFVDDAPSTQSAHPPTKVLQKKVSRPVKHVTTAKKAKRATTKNVRKRSVARKTVIRSSGATVTLAPVKQQKSTPVNKLTGAATPSKTVVVKKPNPSSAAPILNDTVALPGLENSVEQEEQINVNTENNSVLFGDSLVESSDASKTESMQHDDEAIPLEEITRQATTQFNSDNPWLRTFGSLALVLLMVLGVVRLLLPKWLNPQNRSKPQKKNQAPVGWGAFRTPVDLRHQNSENLYDATLPLSPNDPWIGMAKGLNHRHRKHEQPEPVSEQAVANTSESNLSSRSLVRLLSTLPKSSAAVERSMQSMTPGKPKQKSSPATQRPYHHDDDITVLSSTQLDDTRDLHLVQVKDKELVVATTPQGVYLVTHFDSNPDPLNLPPPPAALSGNVSAGKRLKSSAKHRSNPDDYLEREPPEASPAMPVESRRAQRKPSDDFRPEHYAPMVHAAEEANPKAFVRQFSGEFPRGDGTQTTQVVDFVRRWYDQAEQQRYQQQARRLQQQDRPTLPDPPVGVREEVVSLDDYEDVFIGDGEGLIG